jgi:hypothetical protein
MGLLDRFRSQSEAGKLPAVTETARASDSNESHDMRIDVTISVGDQPSLVKLAGTTTFAKDAVASLARRYGVEAGGYLELDGVLQREPENPADPSAVAVHVEGERVGYLPGYIARAVDLSQSGARSVNVQIFTEVVAKGLRGEAWAWLGVGAPQWEWSKGNRPPMSSRAKAGAHHADVTEMVTDALEGGGDRAAQFTAGMVNGIHYLQLIEPIKELKRDGRLEEALTLCYAAIEGAEASAARERLEPAPWYTEQAAIIHRKLGQRDEELAVLERWLKACPSDRRDGSRIQERLAKLA